MRSLRTAAVFALFPWLLSLLLVACSQVKKLSPADSFSDEDKLSYLVLAALAPDAAREYAAAGSAGNRAAYLEWFWRNPPPGLDSPPHSPTSTPQAFYRKRATEARTFYGGNDALYDDRVRTYIRYGPARREQYEPRAVETETSRIFANPAEIWSYDSIGRQFDFVRSGAAFKKVGESRYGPAAVMPSLEQVDLGRPAPPPTSAARPIGLEVSLGRLGQNTDSVEVELGYGIRLQEIAAVFPAGTQPLIHITIDFTPRSKGTAQKRTFWVSCSRLQDTTTTDFAVGREVFNLPADIYTVAVTATAADGRASSLRTRELNLIDYARRNQPVSDVLFYSLIDSTPQSPQFSRPDWARAVPLVEPRVRSGQSFYILYEIYHLAQDSAGNHEAEATYELIERETGLKAVLPVTRRYITGAGPTGVTVERVHTMDLQPRRYMLISRIKDQNDGHTASLTTEFDITPRR